MSAVEPVLLVVGSWAAAGFVWERTRQRPGTFDEWLGLFAVFGFAGLYGTIGWIT